MTAKEILSQILGALPQKRDWLDPVLEAMAKDAVKPVTPSREVTASANTLTPAQLEKLPKFAQEAFRALERERFTAARELKEWHDSQTPGPVAIQEYVCTGNLRAPELMTRYVNTQNLQIEWKGCRLDISLSSDGPMHEDCIKLQWGPLNPLTRALAFVPSSFQSARLQTPETLSRQESP